MKKRLVAILLAIAMIISTIPVAMAADVICDDGCFTVDGITYLLISGKSNEVEVVNPNRHPFVYDLVSTYTGNIVIPSEVKHPSTEQTYKVTRIGMGAFNGYDPTEQDASCDVTSVTLPEGITEIGEKAFSYCTELTNVTLPSTLTTIGVSAFANCTSLTSLEIPAGVTSGLASALLGLQFSRQYDVMELTNYPYAENVTFAEGSPYVIEDGCLYNGTVLEAVLNLDVTSITVQDGTTEIGDYAAYNLDLTEASIPDSVTTIGEGAFWECGNLTEIDWPVNLTSIEQRAFRNTALTNVIIPDGVKEIPKETFAGVTTLETIVIPSGVTAIGQSAFSGLKSTGENATLIMLGATPPTFGNTPFGNGQNPASGLTVIVPAGAVKAYTEDGYVLADYLTNSEDEGSGVRDDISYSLSMSPATIDLYVGDTATLDIDSTVPTGAGARFTITSSNEGVATVDEDGMVTAVDDGTATITARITLNGIELASAACVVTVEYPYIPPVTDPSYAITVTDTVNGTVTVSPRSAREGAEVTITVTPDEGYELADLTVAERFGDAVAVSANGDGTYSFVMPDSQVTISAAFQAVAEEETDEPWVNTFVDVDTDDWYYDYVEFVCTNGLMVGTSDVTFEPTGTVTRGTLMTILARLDGTDTTDSDPWYQAGMEWAVAAGVSDGTDPEGTITREQVATMLWRYAGQLAVAENYLAEFDDADEIHDWAAQAMNWAVSVGVITGGDNGLDPQGTATRAELAAMLTRFCENVL